MRLAFFICCCIGSASVFSQICDWAVSNQFQSKTNPYYWKNKRPREDYWQQDVWYKIKATLNDTEETVAGEEILQYTNNSPFTLNEAFFHLYQNAVQPGSLVDELYNKNKTKHEFGKYEKDKKGTEIFEIKINNESVTFDVNFTILKINLSKPIAPNETVTFSIKFKTYFDRGTIRRRMKVYDHHNLKHFNTVHWYPRICVFDKKFTWETSQHMEHEFYGDFGQYDVELHLPNQYICEATGKNINRDEVLPSELWNKIQIKNFKGKKIDENPSQIIIPNNTLKVWKFHAINVHDFAWTADPSYRIDIVMQDSVECIALCEENNAGGWQPSASFLADVVKTYNEDFGEYVYPKIVAADARDGMEYPMITLDGGTFPGHRGLIAHEVGHNWFFGMLGSNETYRACLDEGFTQFLTAWSMKKLTNPSASGNTNYTEQNTAMAGYVYDAMDDKDANLNTHSDDFQNAIGHGGGYRLVYYKTSTMLYNLQYVLGEDVFTKAMKNYVQKWKIAHPYIEDFRNAITEIAQTDLNWFFDQWFETQKKVDYAIKKIKFIEKKETENIYQITIKRKGDMIMPVELFLYFMPGKYKQVNVPVSYYEKPGMENTSPWIGWGNLRKTYTFKVSVPWKINNAYIDISNRLADINRMDNQWKGGSSWSFNKESGIDGSYLGGYKYLWRPDIYFPAFKGVRYGLNLSGQYANRRHIFNSYAWYGAGFDSISDKRLKQINGYFSYKHYTLKNNLIEVLHQNISDVRISKLSYVINSGKNSFGFFGYNSKSNMLQNDIPNGFNTFNFLPSFIGNQNMWSNKNNTFFGMRFLHNYSRFRSYGSYYLQMINSIPISNFNYNYFSGQILYNLPAGKTIFHNRVFAQFGIGNNFAAENALYSAGANPLEMQENKFARDFAYLNNFKNADQEFGQRIWMNGGLNLRGFTGTALALKNKDTVYTFFRGSSGTSINIEWELTNLFQKIKVSKLKFISFQPYIFADAGMLGFNNNNNRFVNSGMLANAGIGSIINIKNFNKFIFSKEYLTGVEPWKIRIDFPLFLNVDPFAEYVKFRFQIGVVKNW